jgi:phosphoribosylformylglycinamidine synthase
MKFKAEIDVMPLEALLDPQGKAVQTGLHNIGLTSLSGVRVGKHMTIMVEAASQAEANTLIEDACKKMLANPVMEFYRFTVESVA